MSENHNKFPTSSVQASIKGCDEHDEKQRPGVCSKNFHHSIFSKRVSWNFPIFSDWKRRREREGKIYGGKNKNTQYLSLLC